MNKNINMKILEGLKLIEQLDLIFNNPFKCNSAYENEINEIARIETKYALKNKYVRYIKNDTILTGRVYAICSPHSDFIYIGSTTRSLKQRYAKHVSSYKMFRSDETKRQSYKSLGYLSSFEIIQSGDAFIIELATVTGTLYNLRHLEHSFIKNTANCVNILMKK